jgi:hypothetical protein
VTRAIVMTATLLLAVAIARAEPEVNSQAISDIRELSLDKAEGAAIQAAIRTVSDPPRMMVGRCRAAPSPSSRSRFRLGGPLAGEGAARTARQEGGSSASRARLAACYSVER